MTVGTGDWEIAARIAAGSHRIALVVVPNELDVLRVARELSSDIEELSGARVVDVAAQRAEDIEAAIRRQEQTVIRVDDLSDDQLMALDRARSRLVPAAAVVLLAKRDTAARIGAIAPALTSWLAGSVYRLSIVDIERGAADQERLAGLRDRFAMSDQEAVRNAERGQGPLDPEFAVWLVLLGRDDLVAGTKR